MARRNKVPKKIAGVRVPKVFRKSSLLKGLLNTPAGRKLVAEALVAAAGAAAGAWRQQIALNLIRAGAKAGIPARS